MAKWTEYGEIAEQMYVFKMMTFVGIAREIPVSERTLRTWADKYNWAAKRADTLRTRTIARQEAEELYLMLVRDMKARIENSEPGTAMFDKAQADLIKGLHKGLLDMLEYEELTKAKPEEAEKESATEAVAQPSAKKGLSIETLKRIEEELGL